MADTPVVAVTPDVSPAPVATPAPQEPAVADVSWSNLFATSNESSSPSPQAVAPVAEPQAAPVAAPQAPVQADPITQPFLTAGQTVYKTAEEAQSGIAHKDNIIAQLRSQAIQTTGIDPLTGQQVGYPQNVQQPGYGQPQYPQGQWQQPQYQPQQFQQPVSYLQNQQQYALDLRQAVDAGDNARYFAIQQQLIDERLNATVGMYGPMLQQVARSNAVETVAQQIPEFKAFFGSEGYRQALQAAPPVLAQAIAQAEQNPGMASQLPDLYKLVYGQNQTRILSEALKKQTQSAQPQGQVRPTAAPAHATPGAQVTAVTTSQNIMGMDKDAVAARKAYLDSFEKSGRDGKL